MASRLRMPGYVEGSLAGEALSPENSAAHPAWKPAPTPLPAPSTAHRQLAKRTRPVAVVLQPSSPRLLPSFKPGCEITLMGRERGDTPAPFLVLLDPGGKNHSVFVYDV